jgi:hypothetical protein
VISTQSAARSLMAEPVAGRRTASCDDLTTNIPALSTALSQPAASCVGTRRRGLVGDAAFATRRESPVRGPFALRQFCPAMGRIVASATSALLRRGGHASASGTDRRQANRAKGRRATVSRSTNHRDHSGHRHLDLPLQAPAAEADGGAVGGALFREIVRRAKP